MAFGGGKSTFPDIFSTRGPIPTRVTPFKLGNLTYYQCLVLSEPDESEPEPKTHLKPYLDNDDDILDCTEMEDNYDIILTKSGKFQTSLYVPSSLLSFIIGAKGSRLKSLQKNTNTIIKVPRLNEKGDVIIVGDTERKVASARTQISIIVSQRKDKMPPTHFLAIPINSDIIKENIQEFENKVMQNPPRGVTRSIFQKGVKAHLTVIVLTLLDDEEVVKAKNALRSCYEECISPIFEKNKKHKVSIKGLEIMNDDPENVRVLYAKVEMKEPELTRQLQNMCDSVLMYFYRAGLAKKEYDRVKLHMTVMNTSFRDYDEEKMPFDARDILENYKDFNFGEFELNELQVCIRGTTKNDKGETKYYDVALAIPL